MRNLRDFYEMFTAKDADIFSLMDLLLEEAGLEECKAEVGKCSTLFYVKEDVDVVFCCSFNSKGRYLPMLLDKEFVFRHYTKDGKFVKTVGIGTSGYNDQRLQAMCKGRPLVRQMYMEKGYDLGYHVVDHVCSNLGVNIFDELRVCTQQENCCNKFTSHLKGSRFEYNPLHDFRNSFYIPFLHYFLGLISYDDMTELRRMELSA